MLCANRYVSNTTSLPKLQYALASVSLAKAVRLLFTTAQNGACRLRLRPWELSRKKSLRIIVNCCYGDHKLVMCHTQAAVKHSFSTSQGYECISHFNHQKATILDSYLYSTNNLNSFREI